MLHSLFFPTRQEQTHMISPEVSIYHIKKEVLSESSTPSHISNQRKRDVVTEGGAQDNGQEDPEVVGHDTQHQ